MNKVRKYRKIPVMIEAIQYKDDSSLLEIKNFVKGRTLIEDKEGNIYIHTLEGDMKISLNDYVIKGVKGEFYPCKPDVFEVTYECVE